VPKFRSHGQLDDPYQEDGDALFTGMDAFTDPTLLQEGMVQLSLNMRMENGTARVRKGLNLVRTFSEPVQELLEFSDPDGTHDILAITAQAAQGVTDATKVLTLASPVTNATAIQAFNEVIVFDEGQRPQSSDGDNSFIQFTNSPTINDPAFTQCPNAGFGHYLANRLIVPDYADSSTTILVSDILSSNNFNISEGEFFVNKGTNDKILAFASFQENQLLCLNNRSVHIVSNIHSLQSASFEVTRQYGIAGNKAYAQNGSYIYFVSNEGNIQVLVPSSDPAKGLGISISKVTLDQQPLSRPIQPIVNQINLAAIDKSIVHYHKNRVFFAVPYSADLSNPATEPTAVLVYNSLNSVWESIDILPVGITAMASLNGKMYVSAGDKVYEYEESLSDDTNPILGKIITRQYNLGSRGIKKFVRGTIGYSGEVGASTAISVHTKNPDNIIISKVIVESDNKFNRLTRFNARKRGYTAQVEVNAQSGSTLQSEINRVSIEGFVGHGRAGGIFDGN
jgi:hypothetical protein